MKTYLLALILAALAPAPSEPASRQEWHKNAIIIPRAPSPAVASLEAIDEDAGGIAFIDGVIPGLVCPMHGEGISGKVGLALAGWWGRGAGHHIMIDVTYGCLKGCTWLVCENVSQPEPDGPQPIPPRAQRAANGVRPECVFTLSPASINVPYTASDSAITVTATKDHP
jgi:hypothetical protein